METTVNISLRGYIFHLEEDAYERIKHYLDDLKSALSNEENFKEIIDNIEERIAELFRRRLSQHKQVVNLRDVEEIIAILGTPEKISGEEKEKDKNKTNASAAGTRRLYRDPVARVLGGVCSGLSIYTDVPLWLMRAIFVVFAFFGGFSVLVYVILWIVVPEARTASQKIEMEGRPVNIENIKDFVKQEFETVKKRMNL
ncbi:MAG: PspC domain-containing protein [Bacteroidales bacterium]|jgi:phage shock protein PspC (stress-responsive transcriptional regulator)